ncbi:MAG: NADH-quinone oxidoreductase subunit H [Candidatus Aenigmatarchaeota archaeon]
MIIEIIFFIGLIIFNIFLSFMYFSLFRKINAKLQGRKGLLFIVPKDLRKMIGFTKIMQQFYDIVKLFYKETIIPKNSHRKIFIISPIISLFLSIIIIPFLYFPLINTYQQFKFISFDLIIITYAIILIHVFWNIGAYASGSPWAYIGIERSEKLNFFAQISFISSIFSIAILANSLSIKEIVLKQSIPYILLNPFSAIAFILFTLANFHLKPFDMSEIEVEVVSGPFTEYSGKLLGLIELTKTILFYINSILFINIFLKSGEFFSSSIINLFLLLILTGLFIVFLSIINNIFPSYRIDQALKFYPILAIMFSILSLIISFIYKISFW